MPLNKSSLALLEGMDLFGAEHSVLSSVSPQSLEDQSHCKAALRNARVYSTFIAKVNGECLVFVGPLSDIPYQRPL